MACSSPEPATRDTDAGFATPAAAAICLAMAVTVTAVMSLALTALRAARQDLERTQAEYGLAGARLAAVQTLLQSANVGRVRWTLAGDQGPVEVLAEPEAAKLSLKAAADNAPALGALLSARSPERLASALAGVAPDAGVIGDAIAGADASPTWRLCAASFVSPYGLAPALTSDRPAPPRPGPVNWRLGQLWRLRLTDAHGWTDDSVVRFTGAGGHPIAVAARRFTHSGPLGERCDFIAQDVPAS
ncbi:MAG TPA: hypothetical protein VF459_11410 [Caulobacteraceae bacterium]